MRALKVYQSAIAALLVLMFWGLALSLPTRSSPLPGGARVVVGVIGVALAIAGAIAVRQGFTLSGEERSQRIALATVMIIVGIVFVTAAVLLGQPLSITAASRFALGVGGLALAGFAFATTQFQSIRAAASVPVVVLLVGVVVWPGAGELVDSGVRQALITWMGVILAVSGTAEAAKQVGESVAKARAGETDVRARGDLAPADSLGLPADDPQ